MSFVHALIVKDDRLYVMNMHYRTAMRLLEGRVESVLPLLKHRFLDAGYLVIDLNKRVVVNGQFAFPMSRMANSMYVVEA
jgi:hypothetical protein